MQVLELIFAKEDGKQSFFYRYAHHTNRCTSRKSSNGYNPYLICIFIH